MVRRPSSSGSTLMPSRGHRFIVSAPPAGISLPGRACTSRIFRSARVSRCLKADACSSAPKSLTSLIIRISIHRTRPSEPRGSEGRVRWIEIRMIKDVKDFGAELHASAFKHLETLADRKIRDVHARPGNDIPAGGAETIKRWPREGINVEPLLDGLRTIVNVADQIRPILRASVAGIAVVGGHPYIHWRAALQRGYTRNRSEEHTSELQSHSFISYAVF